MMAILILSFFFFIPITIAQNCNDFVTNYGDHAIVALKVPMITNHDMKIKVKFNQYPQGDNGALNLDPTTEQAVSNIKANIPLKYRVRFPFPYPNAQIIGVYHNGRRVCEESLGTFFAVITFTHSLDTGVRLTGSYPTSFDYRPFSSQTPQVHRPNPTTQRPQNKPPIIYQTTTSRRPIITTRRPIVTTTTRSTTTITRKPFTTASPKNDFTCGERYKNPLGITSLIISGTKAGQFDFPWLVAHFYKARGFLCGGSLVSQRIVVTAAHCIQDKGQERLSEYDSTYYLGKYLLSSIDEGSTVISGVEDFYTHDEWDPNDDRYIADIGIAVLTKKIRFDRFIQPICLWDKTQSFNDLLGQEGLVAGWGLTLTGKHSDYPQFISVPVVENDECAASNPVLFHIISNRSFCAGKRSGETPCKGDSGGGFIFKQGDKFYLRGVVSAAVTGEYECSISDYALFTDVAQFTSWIKSFINNFG